ncbi:MAG: hypothetical protein ACLR8Y_11830 [Alistipes indistinctus]
MSSTLQKNLPVTGGTGGRTLLYRTNVVKFGESRRNFGLDFLPIFVTIKGGLNRWLLEALAWHAKGHQF